MVDETGLKVLGGALVSAQVIAKILGPTADLVGQGLRGSAERACKNVGRIFTHAQAKLGDRIEQPGAVPPKVVGDILQKGAFCEDPLAAEYFGGVLASSRTEVSRDDRGSSFTSLISRLTVYQVRAHFIFYRLVKEHFDGRRLSMAVSEDTSEMELSIPMASFDKSMDFSELEDGGAIIAHVMFGLQRETLVSDFAYGEADTMPARWQHVTEPGIVFNPTSLGAELFLWAHGQGAIPPYGFLDPDVKLEADTAVPIPKDAQMMNPPQPK